jgi:hypothetical protein
MTNKILRLGLITLLLLISPLIYTEIQAFSTTIGAFPTINALSAKSKTLLAIIFIILNLISLVMTAIITALPCGYLAKGQPKIIAILFILATQSIPLYAFFDQQEIKNFSIIVMLGEIVAVVFTAFIFAGMGSRIAKKRQITADV